MNIEEMSLEELLKKIYDHCDAQGTAEAEIMRRFEELENKIRNHKKEKDEAVKLVRIQYDSVCDMFHKREREYEDRITDLNNALINQLETGKQKTIYINQLEKEVENLKCCGNCKEMNTCSFKLGGSSDVVLNPPANFKCDEWESKYDLSNTSQGKGK
jgi:vacuolar-type H+-ATPase subunit I/STV1